MLRPVSLGAVLTELEASWRRPAPPATRTVYPRLNWYLSGGFAPGELIYLGARPGVGKTAMGLAIARAVAADGLGVLVISREMVNLALGQRLLSQDAQVSASLLRRRTLDARRAGRGRHVDAHAERRPHVVDG